MDSTKIVNPNSIPDCKSKAAKIDAGYKPFFTLSFPATSIQNAYANVALGIRYPQCEVASLSYDNAFWWFGAANSFDAPAPRMLGTTNSPIKSMCVMYYATMATQTAAMHFARHRPSAYMHSREYN